MYGWDPNKMVVPGTSTATADSISPGSPARPLMTPPATAVVSVLLGHGDWHLRPPIDDVVGTLPEGIVAGDFNGDGRLDLAIANERDDEVSVLLGNGDGTFAPQVDYPVGSDPSAGSSPFSIVAADLNGDGHLDLAVNDSEDGAISVLLGNGDGTFAPQIIDPVGSEPYAFAAGDLNGDGHLDLALTNGEVSVWLGDGDGTFTDPGQLATTPQATPLVVDVDGTDATRPGRRRRRLHPLSPGRPRTARAASSRPSPSTPASPQRDIAWVPETLDGPAVLASVDAQDDAVSLYSYRDGGFVKIASLATGRLPAQVIAADLDGTGFDDLVVRNAADGTLFVYENAEETRSHAPGALFVTPRCLTVGVGVSDVQTVDTTDDGRLDLVVTNKPTGQVGVLSNWGYDVFADPRVLPRRDRPLRGWIPRAAHPWSRARKRLRAWRPGRSQSADRPTS